MKLLVIRRLLFIILILNVTTSFAATYQSVLGFRYSLPNDWQALSPEAVTKADLATASKILGKEKSEQVAGEVRSGKKEYLFKKTKSGIPNDLSIQITQGRILSPDIDNSTLCDYVPAKLESKHLSSFELRQCQLDTSSKLVSIKYVYELARDKSTIRQYEYQVTPNLVLILTGQSATANADEIRAVQDSVASSIAGFFAEYPQLQQQASLEFDSGDYGEAFAKLVKLAELGDLESEYNIAVMYESGLGVTRDYQKAFDYYSRSAQKGSMPAISGLANLYYYGKGVESDFARAAHLYKLAAEAGSSAAQNSYGSMLLKGEGVASSPREAIKWFIKSVKQGNREAGDNLALIYASIIGSSSGEETSQAEHALAILHLNGLTSRQATDLGLELLTRAAESGYRPSIDKLIEIYSAGLYGIAPDSEQANKWRAK